MSDGEGDAEQATLRKTRDVSDQPGSGGKLPSRAPQETRDSGSRRRERGAPGQGREPAVCTLQGALGGQPGRAATALSALRPTSPRRLPSEA